MNHVDQFMSALRVAVPVQPDPALGERLVPRLAAAARASTLEAEGLAARRGRALQRRSRLATIAKVATAVAAIPLLLASLAFAGVTLPEGAQDAFDRVGIELPNQPSDQSAATGQDSGQPASTPATKSEAADGVSGQGNSSEAHQHALEQRQKANGKAKGHSLGKAIGLNEAIPPGLSGDTGPPAHSQAGGSQRSASAPGQLKLGPPHPPRGHARGHGR